MVTLVQEAAESFLPSFRIDIAAMLQGNESLESLSISSLRRNSRINPFKNKAKKAIALVTILQHNTTLKTLSLYRNGSLRLTDDEGKQMVSLLKKNYALEKVFQISTWGIRWETWAPSCD
jgi:hypothetical protein